MTLRWFARRVDHDADMEQLGCWVWALLGAVVGLGLAIALMVLLVVVR